MAKILHFPDKNNLTEDDLAILIRASVIWAKRCRDNTPAVAIITSVGR